MDDAMILFCGHSYGSAGMQHVLKTVGSRARIGNFLLR